MITVIGKASGRRTEITYQESDLDQNLLTWLRIHGVTIASSCDGEGVCKKCVIQNGWLTCEFTLRTYLKICPQGIIEVAYL